MRKVLIFFAIFFVGLLTLTPKTIAAQQNQSTSSAEPTEIPEAVEIPDDEYFRAKVLEVKDATPAQTTPGFEQVVQKVKLKFLTGSEKDKEIEIDHGALFAIQDEQKVKVGEEVVMTKTQGPTGAIYYITDKYRINGVAIIFVVFVALALLLGRARGAGSIIGLAISVIALIKFVIPQIMEGRDPVMVSVAGALIIAVVSIYFAHGLSRRTTVALFSTITTLMLSAILSIVFVQLAQLTGTGSEEAVFLRMGPIGSIDLKGLLLGGIIIGALGILDDITISQSASIDELKKANPNLGRKELFQRGISLGREHIASLINTLALAYAGASFPLLILFSISENVPFWLTLNSEFITEEIIRTLVGSTTLMLAVPISTFMAAYFLGNKVSTNIVEAPAEVMPATRRPRRKKTTTTKRRTKRS